MPTEKAIKSPEELSELFNKYKDWVKANPYEVHDFVGKDADEVYKKRQRPTTWTGFEAWLSKEGILIHLGHYEQNSRDAYTEYLPVIARIKKECSGDIIDGALAGVYNANIAARIEGLTDKKDVEHTINKPIIIDWGENINKADGEAKASQDNS